MTPQAEFGPDVGDDEPENWTMDEFGIGKLRHDAYGDKSEDFKPTDEDHDPDRAIRDAGRNALIAKGAALATSAGCSIKYDKTTDKPRMYVGRFFDGHRQDFYGATLADALIALAEAVGDAT